MTRVDANTLSIASPISGTVYSGGDFGDVKASSVITISGQVWNDNGADAGIRANGLQDGTEPGLAGAIVSLSSGLTQTTGSDGKFLLYAPPDVTITVTETNPTDFVSTNAIPGNGASKLDNDTLIVGPLASRLTSADNLFGDVISSSTAIITGTVFDDQNENGILDAIEPGLPGITVSLEISGSNIITVPTDAAGLYQFAVAPGTDVRITSAGPGGSFYPTTPETVMVRPPAAGLFPDNNFGYSSDRSIAIISGIVFDDANSNGLQDLGELGLPGAVITLTNGVSITTSGNGLITGTFVFSVTSDGLYGLQEKNPPGYRSTTPDDVNIDVFRGNHYSVRFGDTDASNSASIYGVVFDDMNANGARDSIEPGLGGVTVTITSDASPPSDVTFVTNQWGQYTFLIDSTGTYTVTETDPPGYGSTAAIPGDPAVTKIDNNTLRAVVITSTLGTDLGDNSFGDALPADLAISKMAHADHVVAGSTLTYTLFYTNSGPSYAQRLWITDTLPAGVTFGGIVSQDPTLRTFNDDQQPAWYTPTLAANASGTIVFTVTVHADASDAITNSVIITSDTPDVMPSNNTAILTTAVDTAADLTISKSSHPDRVTAGTTLTYTLVSF
jgi:uncharacterized repeat protein (TIGR01451 family)